MGVKQNNLEHLKGQNPFRVPDGYMEGLTGRIMSQLPDKTSSERKTPKIPVIRRLRPWIVAAAAFTGVVFFVNVYNSLDKRTGINETDSLWVQSEMPSEVMSDSRTTIDDEYLEYLEASYSGYILEEELADYE